MRSEAAARRPASNLRGSSLLRNSILVLLATTITISALLPYFLSVQISYESSSNNNDKRQDGTGRLQASNLKDSAATENEGATSNSNEVRQPDYHIVFSTSCTAQQNWESYVFFYHCMRVKQPGTVTRIASGCRHSEATALQQFHEKFIHSMAVHPTQTFALHLTPDYSRVRKTEGKYAYKYMNKPYGLLHWMENGLNLTRSKSKGKDAFVSSPYSESGHHQVHQQLLDGIVILMDPDMILLRPIGHEFSGDHELWIEKPAITKVVHGHPIAQQDGYLTNTWMDLNFSYITGDPSIKPPRRSKGEIHWNTGPPYLATVSDMFQIALLWTDLAPRVVDVHPHLFAEMFGFIIATVMLQLPFSLTKSIVVSTPETHDREGWKFIDSLPDSDICRVPVAATSNSHASNLPVLPTALHYCKRYLLGKSMFSKYRLKKNIMNCDKNLLKKPRDEELFPLVDYMISPPRADEKNVVSFHEVRETISAKRAKREAFMLCGMISAVNEAIRYYKLQACGKDGLPAANWNETYTVHEDPSDH